MPAPALNAADVGLGEAETSSELKVVRPKFDLGNFHVRDFRPTRNETAKVNFAIHIELEASVDERTLNQFEHWRHRLRDQVIIAIRAVDRTDFLEPDLARFRRVIQLRLNRALRVSLVSNVLLTEFTFTTN